MATSPTVLGVNLRNARKAADLSRAGLAAASGTSEPAIAKTELYGNQPRLATIEAWAKALGLRISDLVETVTPADRVSLALSRGACPHCTTPTRQVWHNGETCPNEPAVAS